VDDHRLLPVEVVAALRDVHRHLQQPWQWQHEVLLVDGLVQRAGVHILHDDAEVGLFGDGAHKGDDVAVTDAREDGHLDRELGDELLVEVLILKALDCHLPLLVLPAVDDGEGALAEDLEDGDVVDSAACA